MPPAKITGTKRYLSKPCLAQTAHNVRLWKARFVTEPTHRKRPGLQRGLENLASLEKKEWIVDSVGFIQKRD